MKRLGVLGAVLSAAFGLAVALSNGDSITLTPEESTRLETVILREAIATQEVEIHRLRMEAARTKLAQVRGEAHAVLASICADKCNPDAVVIASDFKTLEVQP